MMNFDDIRPYNDSEVQPALRRIVSDNECLNLLGKMRFSRAFRVLSFILRPLLRVYLLWQVSRIHTVFEFQLIVAKYLTAMLNGSTEGLTVEGLEALDFSKPYLFMSNHRDITLDPAITNYALHHQGGQTVRIAIGDNLLSKPFVSDLMRANKSFIVKRSVGGPRELLKSLKKLSAYVWHSLKVDGENVWIAHREGRAKDGLDKSEPAIIKMLTIARPKDVSFSNYINSLRIVPVSISYEYDPCDEMKARELRILEETGSYTKAEHEDLDSIGLGISGYKGRVHLVFGQPLSGEFENAAVVAEALDKAIVQNYKIQPTNVLAYELLYGTNDLIKMLGLEFGSEELNVSQKDRDKFHARIASMPDNETAFVLNIYANPIVNRLKQISVQE